MEELLQKMAPYRKNAILAGYDFTRKAAAGATKFGGRPDVPADFEWPVYRDPKSGQAYPLRFLAQFDLAEAASYDKDGLLPAAGLLSFFYETETMQWGYDPQDAGCARVLYFPPGMPLHPAEPPTDSFPEGAAVLASLATLPSLVEADAVEEDEEDDYLDLCEGQWDALAGEEIAFFPAQLLGWADLIQDSAALECEIVSRGIYAGDGYPELTPDILQGAEDWTLLLQLRTIDSCDLMFGDDGSIYWYIRKQDLAGRRFDRAWLVLQCY